MAKTLQFRRGTTSELSSQTGAVGELFVDTTKDTVVVMDGSTPGGFPLQSELLSGTNIKTVNGTSLLGSGNITISGSGSTFNQELNTTDDVVFNSALIGDVSITGNTIAGVDSYGNAGTLVVDGGLEVTAGSTTTSTVIVPGGFTDPLIGWMTATQNGGQNYIIFNGLNVTGQTTIDSLYPGDTLEMYDFDGQAFVYIVESTFGFSAGRTVVVTNPYPEGISFNFSYGIKYTRIVDTTVTVASFSETGVAVQGALTVNGQPVDPSTKQDTLLSGTNIKTVNGTSLLGSGNITITGSGSSFNQDLNTTNDVVFNSALIGDVSIIGNEISAVDFYGNNTELVVSSDLTVKKQGTTTFSGTLEIGFLDSYGDSWNGNYVDLLVDGVFAGRISSMPNQRTLVHTLVLSDASEVTLDYNAVGGYVFEPAVAYIKAVETNTYFVGDASKESLLQQYSDGFVGDGSQVVTFRLIEQDPYVLTLSSSVENSMLEVTESGVNVNGTFTVNGQPVGGGTTYTEGAGINIVGDVISTELKTINGVALEGSGDIVIGGGAGSADQNVNTYNDVVFNSALIGDVSIVGNQISGVDSYGNADTLVVDGEMQVNVGSISTLDGNPSQNTIRLQLYSYDVSFFIEGAGTWYFNEDFVRALYNNNPDSSPVVSVTFPGPIGMPDTVITGRLKANGGGNPGEWQFSNTNPATVTNIYFDPNYINEITINGTPLTSHPNYGFAYTIGQQVTSTIDTQVTPLTVTESGVNVNGTFTVNGQPVSGGSGSSFDQDLNTTDDVVFNSALIGNISVIDNTIASTDSYGLPTTLNVSTPIVQFDSNVDLSVNTFVETIDTVTDASYTSQFTVGSTMMSGGNFTYSPFNGSSWADAPKFVSGSLISVNDPMYGTIVIQLTSDFTYDNMDGRWEAPYVVITNNTGNSNTFTDFRSYSVTVTNSSGSLANYSFDDQGIFTAPTVSTDNLLVDGTPAGLLTINQDGSQSVVVDTLNEVVETINAGPGESFNIAGSPGTPRLYYQQMGGSLPFDETKFKVGTVVSLTSMMSSTVVIELTAPLAYNSMNNRYESTNYTLISGDVGGGRDSSAVTITNMVGGTATYDFTETGFIADSALIGEISIVGNEIGVQDSYGLPGTLNVSVSEVVINSNLNLSVDSSNSVTETVTDLGNMNRFTIRPGNPGTPQFTYSPMQSSSWAGASKFKTGTIVSVTDSMYGTKVIQLTSDFTYDNMDMRWEAGYTTISEGSGGSNSEYRSYSVVVTNESGSLANYSFDDQGTFTTTSVIADSALIGDVSIIGNQIAVQDSYGLPGTLNVVASELEFNSSVTLAIDGLVQTTETISGGGGQFRLNYNTTPQLLDFPTPNPTIPFDPNKFVTGTQVTLTDPGFGTFVVELTENLYLGPSRWQAQFTFITGAAAFDRDMYASSVIVNNESGSVVNYDFDDQGTFTAPTVSTNELLINGSAPGFLITNQDGSKSVVVDTTNSITDNVSGGMNSFYVYGQMSGNKFSYDAMGSTWSNSPKFVTGAIVSVNDPMSGSVVIQLTTDMTYSMMDNAFTASYTVISGGTNLNMNSYSSPTVTVTNSSGSITNYDFTESGFVADSALIGEVSIIDNQIAVQDSYGLPGTLNVVASAVEFDSNLDLQINTLVETTENISGGPYQFTIDGMQPQYFYHTSVDGSSWAGASKFVTGTQVTLVDNMYGTVVIELTSDFAYNTFRAGQWASTYTLISGSFAGSASSYSVTITNSTGSTVDYNFDDQGTFTAPTVSTNELLINGSPPGFLITNQDGSKSIISGESVVTTNTVNASGYSPQWYYVGPSPVENYLMIQFGISSQIVGLFTNGTVVTAWNDGAGMKGSTEYTLTLTSDMVYNPSYGTYTATVAETPPNSMGVNLYPGELIATLTVGSEASYNFDDEGAFTAESVVADSALIGNVSVVANTISGTDSYGNASDLIINSTNLTINSADLIINSPLDVRLSGDVTSNYSAVSSNGSAPYMVQYPWSSSLYIYHYNNENLGLRNALEAAAQSQGGTATFNFTVVTQYGTSIGSFKVSNFYNYSGYTEYSLYNFTVTSGFDFYYQSANLTQSSFTVTQFGEVSPLIATINGVSVTGELNVNGQEIVGTNQTLNTTDHVEFYTVRGGDIIIGTSSGPGQPDTTIGTVGNGAINITHGLNVSGDLYVNGQEISTNQTLNTTDNVQFNQVNLGSNFSISEEMGKLMFKYNGTPIASLDATGNFTTLNNVTAYGTP